MKNIKNYMEKRQRKTIFIVLIIIIISTITILFLKNNKIKESQNVIESITLNKKNIINGISTSGVINSDNKTNIFSTQTSPVKEILVAVGDSVKKGDVLAVLDTSTIQDDIEQAKLNYKGSVESLNESKKENHNNIINASTSLEATEISLQQQQIQTRNTEKDLKKIEEKSKEAFNSYSYDFSIEEAKIAAENKDSSLQRMIKEEKILKANLNKFEDDSYRNDISEKAILLERKKSELLNKRRDIHSQRIKESEFDDYTYKIDIEDANRDHSKKTKEYSALQENYTDIQKEYESIASNPNSTKEQIDSITSKLNEVKGLQEKTKEDLNETVIKLQRANEALKRAKEDFEKTSKNTISEKVESAEKTYDQLRNEIEDLEREYAKAVSSMNKARQETLKLESAEYIKLQNTIRDTEYELVTLKNNYEKALLDKEKAMREYIKTHETELESAERALIGNQKQLESLNNNLKSSKNGVKQAKEKNFSTISSDINKLNLDKLESQLEKGKIVATADGVITMVKAEVGTISNDVLFVIEDLDNVHVKANIKEHNLSTVTLGQKVIITTLASGDEKFEGNITFISPRAISANGSPSVEFELNAKPTTMNSKIKPGMNAFLNIIIDSKKDAFAVPITAISKENNINYIYTIENEKIPVKIGISTKTEVEIVGKELFEGMEIKMNINENIEESSKGMVGGGIF